MRDVDFDFYDEDGDDGPDEVLDTGPRRPIPSWVPGLAAAAVLIALFVIAVVHGSHSAPSAAPSSLGPTGSPSAPASIASGPPAAASLNEVYALIPDNSHARLYALAGQRLYALRTDSSEQAESPVLRTGGADDTNDELVLDAVHDIVWVVPQNPAGNGSTGLGVLEGFDGKTMQLVERIPLVGPVTSAAVLDGSLYLLGGHRIVRVEPALEAFADVTRTDASTIVADPARHRLLVVSYGPAPAVRTYAHGRLSRSIDLPFGQGQVAVVGSTIWAGGSTAGTGVLTTLDPRTLHSGRNLAARARLGHDAVIDSVGVHSLYVRRNGAARITCLSGSTGRVLHRFAVTDGTLVSVDGKGFDGSVSALHPVPMGRCPG